MKCNVGGNGGHIREEFPFNALCHSSIYIFWGAFRPILTEELVGLSNGNHILWED